MDIKDSEQSLVEIVTLCRTGERYFQNQWWPSSYDDDGAAAAAAADDDDDNNDDDYDDDDDHHHHRYHHHPSYMQCHGLKLIYLLWMSKTVVCP